MRFTDAASSIKPYADVTCRTPALLGLPASGANDADADAFTADSDD